MSQTMACVLYDYSANDEDELSIYKNDYVTIIETYDDGWWMVGKDDSKGLVPSNYLSVDTQPESRNSLQSVRDTDNNKNIGFVSAKASKSSPRGNISHAKPNELNRLK